MRGVPQLGQGFETLAVEAGDGGIEGDEAPGARVVDGDADEPALRLDRARGLHDLSSGAGLSRREYDAG